MRVLFLNHNVAFGGGTFHRAFHFGVELAMRGHNVTLLSISADLTTGFRESIHRGVRVVETPDIFWGRGRTGWDPTDVIRRMFWLLEERFDVVHGWDCRPVVIGPALLARWLSRRSRAVLFLDWCDWWGRGGTQLERPGLPGRGLYEPVETFFEEAFRLRADGSTVISKRLAARLEGLGFPASRTWILPQGCEEIGIQEDARDRAREELGIDREASIVLSVGTLLPRDGRLLFDSIRLLSQSGPNARLIVVGKHGTVIPVDLRAAGLVIETGFVEAKKLALLIAASDIAAVPLSDTLAGQARWPSRANPILAAGRAVVMTRVSDLAELLEEEGAGYVVEPSAEALAAGIERALRDDGERRGIEHRALALAKGKLAWSRLADTLEAAYFEIGGFAPGPPR